MIPRTYNAGTLGLVGEVRNYRFFFLSFSAHFLRYQFYAFDLFDVNGGPDMYDFLPRAFPHSPRPDVGNGTDLYCITQQTIGLTTDTCRWQIGLIFDECTVNESAVGTLGWSLCAVLLAIGCYDKG